MPIYQSSKSYFQNSRFPQERSGVGKASHILAEHQTPAAAELKSSTLSASHWELTLNWKMGPALLTLSLAFSATNVPYSGGILSVSGNQAVQKLLFTSKQFSELILL